MPFLADSDFQKIQENPPENLNECERSSNGADFFFFNPLIFVWQSNFVIADIVNWFKTEKLQNTTPERTHRKSLMEVKPRVGMKKEVYFYYKRFRTLFFFN